MVRFLLKLLRQFNYLWYLSTQLVLIVEQITKLWYTFKVVVLCFYAKVNDLFATVSVGNKES